MQLTSRSQDSALFICMYRLHAARGFHWQRPHHVVDDRMPGIFVGNGSQLQSGGYVTPYSNSAVATLPVLSNI